MFIHAPVRRTYDRLAATYDLRWRRYIDASLSFAVESLDVSASGRVLDVACGTGELERRLRSHWPKLRMTGSDLSLNMLREASLKDLDAGLVAADVTRLPLPAGSFDDVFCVNAFHYFRGPHDALAEMHRVLRPAGTLVIVDWCDDYLSCKLCGAWLRWTDPAFHRMYSVSGCRELLRRAGFTIERVERRRIDFIWGLMRFICRR
ncbi:MAG TPA: methyltransferase domain-containing protein [Pirellulales bacterium]|nr:methyltransferase domain-containing protein [Pirellulales bacterium]